MKDFICNKLNLNIIISFLVCCLLTSIVTYSQNNINIHELNIGDFYTYVKLVHSDFPYRHDSSYVKCTVIKDITVNSTAYFKFDNYPLNVGILSFFYRYDMSTGRFIRFDNSNMCQNYYQEVLLDSLWASVGDSVKYCSNFLNKCISASQLDIFGYSKSTKTLHNFYGGGGHNSYTSKIYADQFGLYLYTSGGSGSFGSSYITYTLRGCFVNDTLYGDTTNHLSGINQVNSDLPRIYSLSQNYPNPFNPETNIRFEIPNRSNVRISIFDILGNEVSVLVNEELNPGTFEVNWDASNFPSGVYFYKIETDEFSESKKMVLIK